MCRRHHPRRRACFQAATMNDPKENVLKGLGFFEGKSHVLPVSIYYEDTDLSGFVYHANYLRYMERGRTEFFRLAGISKMAGLEEEEPTAWTLRSISVDYLRPARLDDIIHVRSRLIGLTGARMQALQRITRGETLLVEGRIEACITTLTGKPRRLPKKVQETLAPFVTPDET
jgi:acyl-CoA thioester hydrolase